VGVLILPDAHTPAKARAIAEGIARLPDIIPAPSRTLSFGGIARASERHLPVHATAGTVMLIERYSARLAGSRQPAIGNRLKIFRFRSAI
jgi:hypothetical protein